MSNYFLHAQLNYLLHMKKVYCSTRCGMKRAGVLYFHVLYLFSLARLVLRFTNISSEYFMFDVKRTLRLYFA